MDICICYGNCQAIAIRDILKEQLQSDHMCDIMLFPPVHLMTESDTHRLYLTLRNDKLKLFITQPISDNYKNNSLLSTKSIISYLELHNPNVRIIMFPVCYLDFYYPSITYLKLYSKCIPHIYNYYFFDENLLKLNSISKYIEIINDVDFYSIDYLQNKFAKSILELKKRETEMKNFKFKGYSLSFITISEFIEDNYKHQLLFYTRNHPTGILLKYIILLLFSHLTLDLTLVSKKEIVHFDKLNNKKFPIYKSLQKIISIDIDKCNQNVCLFEYTGINDVARELLNCIDNKIFKHPLEMDV